MDGLPTSEDVAEAAVRLLDWVLATPCLEAQILNQRVGHRVLVKAECLQHGGSFKIRGALNRLLRLSHDERRAGIVAFSGVVPGLIGTIRSSFTNLSNDPSVEGRTEDYNIIFTYIGDRPWFGRGPGTFLPARYIVLDNEALYTLATMGYVGLVAVLALVICAMLVARNISRNAGDDASRHLAIALMAPVLAALLVSLTFDSLSFPIFSGLLFFIFGAIGALWRLDREGDRSGRIRRRTPLLKSWRSIEHYEPHGLWDSIGISEKPGRSRRKPLLSRRPAVET